MSEFTPGKWIADDFGEYVSAHGEDMRICHMRGWAFLKNNGMSDYDAIEVQKANARLIAAAPDMYDFIKSFADEPSPKDAWDFLPEYILKAKIIIDRINGNELSEDLS